jgi:hypothetical protein
MSFWLEADAKSGGKISGLTDAEIAETLNGKADEAHAAGHLHTEAGMRKALAEGPDKARDYLAMMRVVGNAAKRVKESL